MSKISTAKVYDFACAANGQFNLLVQGDSYLVLTASNAVSVSREGGSELDGLVAGQGEDDVEFTRLSIRDKTGLGSTGTILVSSGEFVDKRLFLSGAVQVRPEAYTGYSNVKSATVANTAELVLAAGANVSGVIVQAANFLCSAGDTYPASGGLLAKATAPASVTDGIVVAPFNQLSIVGASYYSMVNLQRDVLVPAGLGLYWITDRALGADTQKSTRYKVL